MLEFVPIPISTEQLRDFKV